MSNRDLKALAERYLRDQFAIMKKHGNAPKLSKERYQEAVGDTQQKFATLIAANKAPAKMKLRMK